ncbi:MAG: acyltransferase [Alphaproteobacteria bacterium]|nr:acyltransferase [Alphaproteobacteria bacterium]
MNRSWVIDLIKLLAAQVIVLHHLAVYTPMAELLSSEGSFLLGWLNDHGRLAVQPFLVIGGYLAAQSIRRRSQTGFWVLVGQRYLRLMPALAISLLGVVILTWALGQRLAGLDWVSPLPGVGLFLAHVFMLQDVLGWGSISAGAWYVAIDLQLFALFVLLMKWGETWPAQVATQALSATVAALTLASVHLFSRLPDWDVWAIYFFSAYGLGVLVAWSQKNRAVRPWLLLTVGLLLLDVTLDPRPRPLWALTTACVLWAWGVSPLAGRAVRWQHLIHRWADGVYGLFVSHFVVVLFVTSLWFFVQAQSPWSAWMFLGLGWLLSQVVGRFVDAVALGLVLWTRPRISLFRKAY